MDENQTLIDGARGAPAPGVEIDLARGTVFAGRYEIRRLLGRGGAGFVVQAHDRALDENVAIKLLRPEHGADSRWIDRLAREVKLARQIRHPNVCRVFDFGQADGRAYLVMELARGSLRDELAGAPPARTLEARLADACAVASGVAAVHAAGVVHRDVTPQNVLRMSDGRLVVSDFGLATDADPTTSSLHGGTVAYMAPEIARGEHATFASDVWSLGAILHEIVFGRRPHWRESRFGATLEPSASGASSRVERRMIDICRRCMVEHGRRRPRADEVSRLLEDAGLGRRSRGSRRARVLALGAGLAAAVALVSVLGPRGQRGAPRGTAPASELAIAFEGTPADWSRSARVLGTFDEAIQGIATLPGGTGVRIVWGERRRAEDIDLASGARRPVALPPLPDRAGPPVLSPDGASIAFEGYAAGRPFVFLASSERGARPVPASAAADPSLASEPRWLAGGRAFVFDADLRNVGVFSLDSNRATILPSFDAAPAYTTFKAAVHDRVLVARIGENVTSQIAVYAWPTMAIVARLDLPAFAVEWQSDDGHRLFGIAAEHGGQSQIIELDLDTRHARRVGMIPGRSLRTLARAGQDLVFASFYLSGDVSIEDEHGGRVIAREVHAREIARGGGHILLNIHEGGSERIAELDEEGRWRGFLTSGPYDEGPSVLPGGREWTFVRRGGDAPGYYRCSFGGRCSRVISGFLLYATVSPDGARVAYIDTAPQGARARLVGIDGQGRREIGDASSYCQPVWSSPHTLWISRRTEGTPAWVELDVDGDPRPTGRRQPGARDCSDGLPDPASPVRHDGVKLIVNWRSELRVQRLP